ncbi:MAG TPA: hypothetical protein VN969_17700 [Streptosporangiaceae bacterium]|nr:hypothetical protein [Streptosporangiaceae bacterium]
MLADFRVRVAWIGAARVLDSRFQSRPRQEVGASLPREDHLMGIILLVLLLAVILGGLGFAIHILWWIALVVLFVWLIGFAVRAGEGASRSRWYRW